MRTLSMIMCIALPVVTSCSSTKTVQLSPPDANLLSEINSRASGRDATVLLSTGRMSHARDIVVESDSTTLFKTGPAGKVRTVEIERITIVSRGRGALEGCGVGLLVGAAMGALAGLASGDDPPNTWFGLTAGEKAVLGGTVFGVLGGLVGLPVGYAAGHKDIFELESPNEELPP